MIRWLLLFLCVPGMALAQESVLVPPDPMRGFIWSLPREEVRSYEPAYFVEEKAGNLYYMDEIDIGAEQPYKALIEYRFDGRGLSGVRYDFVIAPGRHPDDTLNDATAMQHWLEAVFDQEARADFTFRSDALKNDPALWGWGVYRGQAIMRFHWQTQGEAAQLVLSGDDLRPSLTLILARRP